jgi:hypothetical protein
MNARGLLRIGLLVLTVYHLVLTGAWALLLPRSFYDGFPWPGHPWVRLLPPFNEHLIRDFGGLNVAMGVVLGAAAVILERRLVCTALVADVVFAVPHFIYHSAHLEHFPTADAVVQTILLAVLVVLPLALLIPARRLRDAGRFA